MSVPLPVVNPFFLSMDVLSNALDYRNEAQCTVTCYALADEHLKWRQNTKHPFVVRCLQSRLCRSTSAGGLGRRLHGRHLRSRRLQTRRAQMASERGLSETAGLADVKVYWILQILCQKTHSFLFLALKENGGCSGNPGISLEEPHFP